jgi:hypothetical protein
MDVHDYLERAGRKPWIWGGGLSGFNGQDCTLFTADWAMAVSGEDPGDGIRGTYDDEAGALAVLRHWGGPVPFVESRLVRVGWSRSFSSAEDGNIGVVRAPLAPLGVSGFIPAIHAGGLWVIRTLHGQRSSAFECVAVFRP